MSEYETVRKGKLVLKGEAESSKKRKHKKEKKDKSSKKPKVIIDEDAVKNGGWWKCDLTEQITGSVAIQFGDRTYVKAMDNGLFTLGAPHDSGDGPSPEEELTAFIVNDKSVIFKSGYGKYLKIEKDGIITGRSEAIGSQEQWEPIWENGKMALLGATSCFMSIDPEDDALVALRKSVGEHEVAIIRSNAYRGEVIDKNAPIEEKIEDLDQVELNYVKKFQKFQDKKMRLCKDDKKDLEQAKVQGTLHESLLDRRSKMKADRYCK